MIGELSRKDRRVLLAAGLPLAVGSVNLFGVTLALIGIQAEFSIGFDGLRWILIAFLIPDAVVMLLAGRLGDAFGRGRILFAGGAVFAVAALASALAPSFGALVAFRAVEGLGAGLMFGGLLAIVADSFPRERLGGAFGAWSLVGAFAFGVAPLLTGTVIHLAGWRWLFVLNALVAAVAALVAYRLLPDDRTRRRLAWDPPGLTLLACGLALLALGAVQGPSWGWLEAPTLLAIAGGAALLGAAGLVEARSPDRLWSGYALHAPRLLAGTGVVTVGYLVQELVLLVLVVYLFFVRELNVLEIGTILLSYSLVWALVAPLGGRLADRVGSGPPIAAGALIAIAGAAVLAIGFAAAPPSVLLICAALAVLEIGAALANPASNAVAMRRVAPERRGEASGVSMMLRLIGSAAGIAAGASVLLSRQDTIISGEVSARGGDAELLVVEDLGGLLESRAADDTLIDLFGDPDGLFAVSAAAFESATSTVFWLAACFYALVAVLALRILRSERAERVAKP